MSTTLKKFFFSIIFYTINNVSIKNSFHVSDKKKVIGYYDRFYNNFIVLLYHHWTNPTENEILRKTLQVENDEIERKCTIT